MKKFNIPMQIHRTNLKSNAKMPIRETKQQKKKSRSNEIRGTDLLSLVCGKTVRFKKAREREEEAFC